MKQAKLYKIKHIVTGEEHVGTTSELAKIIYVAPQTINKMALQGRPIVGHWMATLVEKPAPIEEIKPMSKCLYCGKQFIPKIAQQQCCNRKCNRDMHTKRVQEELKENTKIRERKPKPRPKPKVSLKEMVIAAEAAGMKYGEYVAMVECGMKIEK